MIAFQDSRFFDLTVVKTFWVLHFTSFSVLLPHVRERAISSRTTVVNNGA